MKLVLSIVLLFASTLAFAAAGPWKSTTINETTSNVHNYVFTPEEVCQVLFFRTAVANCQQMFGGSRRLALACKSGHNA